MPKLIITLSAILLLNIFLTGCIRHMELNEKAMAQTVAIDFEEGYYTLSAKYYTGSGPKYKGDAESDSEQVMLKTKGQSLSHAIKDSEYTLGKPLIFGEFKTIVLGRGVLEGDILDVLRKLSLLYESYPHMAVIGSLEKAEDILNVKYKGEPPDTSKLNQMIETAYRVGICPISRIENIIEEIEKTNTGFYLPLIEIKDTKSDLTDDGKEIFINGGAIIKDGKMAGICNNYISAGISLYANEGQYSSVTIEHEGYPIPIILKNIRVKTNPQLIDEKLTFYVNLKGQAEYMTGNIDSRTMGELKPLEDKINAEIAAMVHKSSDEIIKKHAADFIGLENIIRNKNYRLWTKIEDEYDEYLKNSQFIITAEAHINRYVIFQ